MRAYIKMWDKEFLIEAIGWLQFGPGISHVSFTDESGNYLTVYSDVLPVKDGEKSANLDSAVYWKEK
ncbi:hypothetical protein [Oceanobacillus sp. FSL H7-0719]|uniref:hypothetical protein n=1 Tax=Oceanobacillus sp. FSL H7-0719 TaxID=2954507 RepID=UPI00324E572B